MFPQARIARLADRASGVVRRAAPAVLTQNGGSYPVCARFLRVVILYFTAHILYQTGTFSGDDP
ncbi:MAG: hypothetical protein CMH12_20090 [Maritimibacter sp.]|nr:hypothetical protein [Maritimibacter sp.]